MRSTLKRSMYRVLVGLRAPQLARLLRPGAPVLCFHNVVAEADVGVGDTSLHMPVGTFTSIVQWLASSYEVVPVEELVGRAGAGRSVRGLAAITFDDAYRGVFEHALPVLAAAGLPCTLFVVTGFADHPAPTWWDTLAARRSLSEERREEALTRHRGLTADVLAEEEDDGAASELPDVLLPAPWDRVVRATGDLVTLGSHTARHPNLTVLDDAELDEELRRSRHEIHDRTGREPDALAYPYGLWDPRVASATRRAGYRVGLTLEGGPVPTARDLMAAPRLNVPAGISPDALACWAAGIRPRRLW